MGPWIAAAALLCLASSAWADDGVYNGVTPSQVEAMLRQAGYPVTADLGKDPPVIWSRQGTEPFGIFLYSCTHNADPLCQEIQFYAGFPVRGVFPTVLINEWNRTRRFGRAYIDADHNAALEMDLDADGTSDVQLRDALQWWQTLVPQFQDFLDQTMKTS